MKRILRALTLTAVLTASALPTWAQDFEKGVAAARAGDFETALQEWHPLAEQGDVKAQKILAVMHYYGRGVPQDCAEAVKWYRLAAEQGEATAQSNLGKMYAEGEGVLQDNLYAHMWFNIAASLGAESSSENRATVASGMTAEDISKAQAMARDCVAKDYKGC